MRLPASVQDLPEEAITRRLGIGFAHAKIILLGEHAVVYGAPALALPVPDLTVTAKAIPAQRAAADPEGFRFLTADAASDPVAMEPGDGLRSLVSEFTEVASVASNPSVDVVIDSLIPPGRGLGSSAACARAVVLALADLFGRQLGSAVLFDLVQAAEITTHGRASGIDTLATGSPSAVLLSSGVVSEPRIGFEGYFVIGDSGEFGRTRDAVESLRQRFQREPETQAEFARQSTALTRLAVRDLREGRAGDFGARMNGCHSVLRDAGLSTERIDTLVEAALTAGGLGAKISGGGLGGCMVALTDEPQRAQAIAQCLMAAGAERTWITSVGGSTRYGC